MKSIKYEFTLSNKLDKKININFEKNFCNYKKKYRTTF